MSSLCVFTMKITGFIPEIEKLIQTICDEQVFRCLEDLYMGDYTYNPIDKIATVIINGASKYSAEYGLLKERYSYYNRFNGDVTCLENETKDKEIFIEIFSQNDEDEFQEHIYIERGKVIVNDACNITVHRTKAYGGFEEMGNFLDYSHHCRKKINDGVIEIYL